MKRYNELAATGKDEDFGKPANYLVPVDTPPFYGIHRPRAHERHLLGRGRECEA